MINEKDRAKLGDLVLRAIDEIIERYGEEAKLEDALFIYEISFHSNDGEKEIVETIINYKSTTHRSSVQIGLASIFSEFEQSSWKSFDSEDE